MNLIKKILIVLIIVLFTYILWRLLKSRVQLKREATETENFSLFGGSKENEFNSLKKSDGVKILNVSSMYYNLPLREYCIKNAYNSALTGNYINLDMISYVLNRGCRFLDFEIFYIGEDKIDEKGNTKTIYTPRVAYSTDNTFTTINSVNSVGLDDVFLTILNSAFSTTTPNPNDPLFINLRIKSNNPDVYKTVAASIHNAFMDKLYIDNKSNKAKLITRDTKLSDVLGKIVMCIDKTVVRNYKDYTSCDPKDSKNCYDLKNFINIETGSEELNLLRYSEVMDQCTTPITITNDNVHTDVKTIRYVIPNSKQDSARNPSMSDFILKYSSQVPAYRFYKNDLQLQRYEEFFDDNKSSFVPLANAIVYFKNMDS